MFPVLFRRPAAFAVASLLAAAPAARPCGPDFPNCYLVESADEIARLPTLSLEAELRRLLPPGATGPAHPVDSPAPESPEIAEARQALVAAGLGPDEIRAELALVSRLQPSAKLPLEFRLYGEGARAWHSGQPDEAVARWREVLALPADARHYRTTWAAFMIGRARWNTDEGTARAYLALTRETARKGFADSEALAVASLGWEARIHLRHGEYAEALRLYFRQFSAGGNGALESIQFVLADAFRLNDEGNGPADPGKELRAMAADPTLRAVVTAWFGARGGPDTPWSATASARYRRWIAALGAEDQLTPGEADRWAWAAYQNGMWDEAARFARRAPGGAPASEWVRAMLLLREDDDDGAVQHLANAARAFPTDPGLASSSFGSREARYSGETDDLPGEKLGGVRGVLALQRRQYAEALRLFLEAGHWTDAAYVAENVLSLDELTEFVRTNADLGEHQAAPTQGIAGGWNADERRATAWRDLRHLLARRLVRNGRLRAAREFFPAAVLPSYDAYVEALTMGERENLPPRTRADALWAAAQLMRDHGMEFQGTELEPDFFVWDGSFTYPDIAGSRFPFEYGRLRWRSPDDSRKPPYVGTRDEYLRFASVRQPARRFHFRQRAAEIAFLASLLLPDNDEQTALILNTAGRWIAARYPDDAQLFYKTLVFRCPRTELGRMAAARCWLVWPEANAKDSLPEKPAEG